MSLKVKDLFPAWALATNTQDTAVKVTQLELKYLLKAYLKANINENAKYYMYSFMLKQWAFNIFFWFITRRDLWF